jgi:integrase
MPRKPNQPPIVCQYFTWRLLLRDGVYYADGRGSRFNLGKHSLGTRNRVEALERLRQLDHQKAVELELADAKPAVVNDTVTIADGWKRYLDHSGRSQVMGGISANSLKRYGTVRDKHVKFCARQGINTWAEFSKARIEQYGNQLSRKYADRTVFLELTLLKSVVNWLVANGHLPAGSDLNYPLRKPQGTDTYCYSPAEVSAMVAYCRTHAQLAWLANVIVALAHTGLRISELASLRWSDINLTSNKESLTVADERSSRRMRRAGTARTTKGRRSRKIPIHPGLKELLMSMERQADGYVFHAARGGKLLARNVLQMFIDGVIDPLKKKFPTPAGEIGFEHGRLHSFRHFFCSQAFLGGASEGEIKEWLGHADSKMVEHYRHLRSEDAQRKMGQIEFMRRPDERSGDVA